MTGFWKGALKAIEYAMQLNTFNELEYFKNALVHVQRALQREERAYNKYIGGHREQKKNFLNYY
jgi:hypothetical protein